MKISDQQIAIAAVTHDQAGNKLEPEERPAQKLAPLPVSVSFARPAFENPGPPIPIGDPVTTNYPASVALDTTAGEIAESFVRLCVRCKHFNPNGFQKYLDAAHARNDRAALAEAEKAKTFMIQTKVVQGRTEKELRNNAEIALRSLGQCGAWTEATKVFQATHPLATCELFTDKDVPSDMQRATDQKRDKALRMAQGKE